MKQSAHFNPKSTSWVISLVVMIAVSAAVIFGSEAIYGSANKKYTEPVEVDFTIASTQDIDIAGTNAADYNVTAVEEAYDTAGALVGYVVKGTTVGYNAEEPIELAVTISADGTLVLGIDVLRQKETEYLGEKIATDAFKGQFTGRYLPVVIAGETAQGSPIDAISKATISSKAVVDGVNRAQEFVLANYTVSAAE
ncbi:FMN-binding protein [Anaerovoracaceae bacterium 41-7]|uniref:FMN-binding protein n=1 Tax=Anaerotruncus colihominis TaxID=169435 RepID=A0A845QGI9_9FIRM|nr:MULTISPECIES: FMN-binding protein [Anaerotruncus]MCI9639782.1 FMN-binding protein [Emergencia sp.]NBH61212.1 FMN-binding protein [Anaerotruncus colihominis]NCF01867.1 FMN-binding protein [Anaerotruncus sp. 80]